MTRLEIGGAIFGFGLLELNVAAGMIHPALGWAFNGMICLCVGAGIIHLANKR